MRRAQIMHKCCNSYCSKNYYVTSDMIEAYYEGAHLQKSKGRYLFASMINDYTNVDINRALRKIEIPINLIESEDSTVYPEYKECNDLINTTVIEGTSCLPHIEAPKRTIEAILKYC